MSNDKERFTAAQQKLMRKWAKSKNAKHRAPDIYQDINSGWDKSLFGSTGNLNLIMANDWQNRRQVKTIAAAMTVFLGMYMMTFTPDSELTAARDDKNIAPTEIQTTTQTHARDSATIDFAMAQRLAQEYNR